MKWFNDRKIMTKILSLVAFMIVMIVVLGTSSYYGVHTLRKSVDELVDRTDRLRITNEMIDAQTLLMYAEMSIPVKDTAESVQQGIVRGENFAKVYANDLKKLRAGASANETKFLAEIEKTAKAYNDQWQKTLREAKALYVDGTLDDDTAMKDSITANEKNGRASLDALFVLADNYASDVLESKEAAYEAAKQASFIIVAMSGAIVLVGFGFGFLLSSRGIAKPLTKSVDVLKDLANNNLDVHVDGADRKDEIGDVARAANFFKESLVKQRELVEAEKREQIAKEKRQQRVQELIAVFDETATQTVSTVASASTQLSQTAEQMSRVADETNRQSVEVESASEQASNNVQAVASAGEEMAATVQEISRQISLSNNMVQDAMQKAEAADTSSRELVNMSSAVGDIATLIEDIAGQINLLALNATIESARSGEAGKGFAVVANEVKNLATQTAKATEQIRQQLAGVQKTAVNVADVLLSVREAISKVDETSATIAAAVEEQSAATQEIVSNMNTATMGVEQINGGIFSIKGGTDSTTAATREVLDAARMLSTQAEKMDDHVKSFLRDIQSA